MEGGGSERKREEQRVECKGGRPSGSGKEGGRYEGAELGERERELRGLKGVGQGELRGGERGGLQGRVPEAAARRRLERMGTELTRVRELSRRLL